MCDDEYLGKINLSVCSGPGYIIRKLQRLTRHIPAVKKANECFSGRGKAQRERRTNYGTVLKLRVFVRTLRK